MTLVTVSGYAWAAGRVPIPAELYPELWFRPERAQIVGSLLASPEVQAALNVTTGAFTVKLESFPGALYTPVMRWRVNPLESRPEKWAYGRSEWPAFHPGSGGDIGDLEPYAAVAGILYGFGPPPASLTSVVYLDISGSKPIIYGPKGA